MQHIVEILRDKGTTWLKKQKQKQKQNKTFLTKTLIGSH